MALIQCPECSKEVSSAAPQCPGCGYPISQPPPPSACPTAIVCPATIGEIPSQTHIVVHQAPRGFKGLVKSSWILILGACLISIIPFLGFASWLIAGPVFTATFIMAIMVMTRGGTLQGISLLIASMFVAPLFVFFAPFLSSLLGIAGTGVAIASRYPSPSVTPSPLNIGGGQVTSRNDLSRIDSLPPPSSIEHNGNPAQDEERRRMLADAPALIVGSWHSEDGSYMFSAGGSLFYRANNGGDYRGQWVIDGSKLQLTLSEVPGNGSSQKICTFQILSITPTSYIVEAFNSNQKWHGTRVDEHSHSSKVMDVAGARIGERWEADLGSGVKLELCGIPAGSFSMGGTGSDETPHQVTLTKPFWLGRTEVTQEQWQTVMGSDPSNFKGKELPVETVSWNDASNFCKELSAKGLLPEGWKFALPSEAQWEYACRAATTGEYIGAVEATAWHLGNSGSMTHPVGTKQANAWGLYDMLGNVWEWCSDWHAMYPGGSTIDQTGPNLGMDRMLRGGSWSGGDSVCRPAARYCGASDGRYCDIGFRVAVVPEARELAGAATSGSVGGAVARDVVPDVSRAKELPAENRLQPPPSVSQWKQNLTPEEKILDNLFTEMFATRTAGGEDVVNLLHKYGFVHKGPVPTFPAEATAEQSKERLRGLVNDLLKLAKTNKQAAAIVTKFNLSKLKLAK